MFKNLNGKKLVLGLVHLRPMPSTPYYKDGDIEASLQKALADVKALKNGGADGCLLQSVDKIYPATDDTDYARVATLSMISARVRDAVGKDFLIGVQLMFNCITPSLAVAKATDADFVRCSALVGVTDSVYGPITANPLKVANYRRCIEAQNVELLSEISGYHFKGGSDPKVLQTMAANAARAGADAFEICSLDEAENESMVRSIKEKSSMAVILGGGTNVENCQRRLKYADGALVGSCFEDGKWGEFVVESIVADYCKKVREIED